MKKLLFTALVFSVLTAQGQQGSEILLFDLTFNNGKIVLSAGRNITNNRGYDNQPYFHPSKPLLYYSSFNDSGRSDIKVYNLDEKSTTNLTLTDEREYSPTVSPGEKYISCIIQRDNGAQDLGKYPVGGGAANILISELVVGYHAWAGNDELMLFVLGDSNRHTLHYYNLRTRGDEVIATNIGRSLHRIPGTNVMSFIQKTNDSVSIITQFEPGTRKTKPLVETIKGNDHIAWFNDQTIISSDGISIYALNLKTDKGWHPVTIQGDKEVLKGITRIAVNTSHTKLAIVVSEVFPAN